MKDALIHNQDELRYEIGSVCLSFKVKHKGIKKFIKLTYKDYVSYRKPDIYIDVEYKKNLARSRSKSLIFQNKFWKIGRENGKLFFYVIYKDKSCVAWFDDSLNKVKIYTQDSSSSFFLYLFPEILFSLILSKREALMVHGCGILDGKNSYLFLAPSGGGKSTIARLALKKGFKVLNDDRIIISKEKDLFRIYSSPWCKNAYQNVNTSQLIKKAFFLKKSKFNKVKPVCKRKAMIEFLKNNLCIPINRGIIKKRFDFYSDLAENLKCYQLSFKPDESIWRLLNELVE